MELETDVVTHASGSARLRLANTDILVGVKAEIDVPSSETPTIGKIEFFIDWFVMFYELLPSEISNSFNLIIFNLQLRQCNTNV